MYPYRPDAASDDPQARLADGPCRIGGTLSGLAAIGVICAILLVIVLLVWVRG